MRRRILLIAAALPLAAVLLALLAVSTPGLALHAMGLNWEGTVQSVLTARPTPAPEDVSGQPLNTLTTRYSTDERETVTYSVQELGLVEATGAIDAEGQPEYRLVFDEAGFNRFFQTQFGPWLQWLQATPYDNVWFDLRDGGMVAYGRVNVNPDFGGSLPPGVPYIGIRFQYVKRGIEVTQVLRFGPADRAGLEVGDVICELDGTRAADAPLLPDWIQSHVPGDTVTLELMREGQRMDVEVELEAWSEGSSWHDLGLVLAPDATGARLVPLGLIAGEEVYSLPDEGTLAATVADAERLLDDLLEGLVVVGPLEGEVRVAWIGFAEDRVTVVMR